MAFGFDLQLTSPSFLRPGFDVTQESRVLSNGIITPILTTDVNRVTLAVQSTGATRVGVSPISMDSVDVGFLLFDGNNPVVLSYGDLGPLIGEAWFAVSIGGNGRLMIITASWRGVERV